MKNVLSPARIGAAVVVAPAVIVLVGGPALAADNVSVSNTETVQAHLDASGHVRDARVYEQLALQGHGTVTVSDPVSTRNLRNLDGFGGFDVKGANLVANVSVDGERRLRAVSDFTKELPLKVTATYTLDGKKVEPGDVVGRSGLLQVHYVVENITGRDQEVSFDDGTGTKVTRTEKVVIPMVGSLTTVLPSTFTDVRSDEAAIAGDGHGGTKMTFTMTLFGPIGSPRAEFGYAAKVADGVVPAATVSALPVSPLDSPSFKGGAASYKGGADTGLELTSGATQIDSNVLKLRDGAAQLLAGLIKLRDGAKDLNAGLSGKAAPGAAKLATGAGAMKSGTGKLAKGAGDAKAGAAKLSAGAGQLSAGLGQAAGKAPALMGGLSQVQDGLGQLDAGLVKMYGGIGQLPDKAKALHDGIGLLRSGLGDKDTQDSLVWGVDQVRAGLGGDALAGLDQVKNGLFKNSSSSPGAYQRLDCAQKILADVINGTTSTAGHANPCYFDASTNPGALTPLLLGLHDTLNAGGPGVNELSKSVTQSVQAKLAASLGDIVADPGNVDAINATTLVGGINAVKAGLGNAIAGLARVECGLDNTAVDHVCDGSKPGLRQGVDAVDAGVNTLVNGVVSQVQGGVGSSSDTPADQTLRGGVNGLTDGVSQIQAGGKALLDGLDALDGGANQVAGGAKALDSGLGQLQRGAGQLDTGAGQLKSGADQLSSGLGDAATGSGKLADGLETAAGKAPALEDGASRLSAEGTTKLVDAGKGTAADYGLKYALIEAGAQRAKAEGMAYGAPAGATGATAYSLELAGMSGEGSRNVGRGLGAVAVFGLGAGLTVLRRRWL
ncbi:hypothetical protein [Oryzihumus sp.]